MKKNRLLAGAIALTVVALASGAYALSALHVPQPAPLASDGPGDVVGAVIAPTIVPSAPAAPQLRTERVWPEQSDPVRLDMPSIDVSTELEFLGLQDDGALATPVDTDLAGWYRGGPRPGELGPAVIAGHVTWDAGPSVFFRLSELTRGDIVTVTQDDGTAVDFEVERIEQHPKDEFPTLSVYGNTPWPTLRLITCGGEIDSATGSHRDNIVVYARVVDDAL